MRIRIVTDSTADLPPQLAADLGIVVVPAYVHFGERAYRDRMDIGEEEFYRRLLSDPTYPYTAPPTPVDFANAYQRLSSEADGIVSIHISGKLSATCNSALRGKELLKTEFPIQVIDSQSVTMGLGLLAIAAAVYARSGEGLPGVVDKINRSVSGIHMLGMLDTLKYLARGGRIGRAKAMLGSVLNVKPMLTMKDGELESAGRVRTRAEGIDRLLEAVRSAGAIEDLAVVYSTTPEEAKGLAARLDSVVPGVHTRVARLGPVLGVHGGPGILFVAARTKA